MNLEIEIHDALLRSYYRIEAHSEHAVAEIKFMGSAARQQLKRSLEFGNRSEGQRRRFAQLRQQGDSK